MFSILIPSWNNLPFLRMCVESIRKNSAFNHQIIIHINEGSDGTLEWVKANSIEHSFTQRNHGICVAVNEASKLAKQNYIVYMNDDMYALPQWDKILLEEIQNLSTDCFMLSSTLIEPLYSGNDCAIDVDYGKTIADFQEQKLLSEFSSLNKEDWSGSTWPPTIVHKKWWEKVGGYSEEFSPGMSSDDDFAMKMWTNGCRIFKGVGRSRIYHFMSKSTMRVERNDGRKQFLRKWGIKQSLLHKYYTRRGEPFRGELTDPKPTPDFLFSKLVSSVQRLYW
ncbi:MAG: glycosyltransferase family 2 protein [Chitinophagales bacterium]